MGIYQIIAIHSRPWSQREIVFFGNVIMAVALLLLAAAGIIGLSGWYLGRQMRETC